MVLFEDTWLLHVLDPHSGHAELEPHLAAVLEAIASPDHRKSDAWPHRERFFEQDVGPSRWLMVVVDPEQEPARIVTALGCGHDDRPLDGCHEGCAEARHHGTPRQGPRHARHVPPAVGPDESHRWAPARPPRRLRDRGPTTPASR